jgi:hypothetical protein
LLASLAFTVLAYYSLPWPLVWIAVFWVACFSVFMVVSKKTIPRAIWLNISFCFLIVGAVEFYSATSTTSTVPATASEPS